MEQLCMDERERLAAIARKHDIALVAIFGSHARGEARPDSDVDLYVRFGRDVGLFEMLGIKHEFEDATGRPVDLIAEELVEPYSFVREGMAKDLAILYEKSEAYGAAMDDVPALRDPIMTIVQEIDQQAGQG